MRRALLTAIATVTIGLATPAFAANPPTLHGFCSLGNVCTDNGTNTPTSGNPPTFAFSASPGPATGDLLIDILVPNNAPAPSGPFTISGALSGTATLFSPTAWTSGQLDAYLGTSASPTNPIGAFTPAEATYAPGTTGFYVFTADLGSTTLIANGDVGKAGQDSYLLQLGQGLPVGSYIVGFLDQPNGNGATANSGAILITDPYVPEPATWAMMLLGFGGIGMAVRRSRRRDPAIMQIA